MVTETRVQVTREIRVSNLTLNRGDVYYYTVDPKIIHRDNDLPAVIKADGTQEWLQHGLRHRDNDLPAIIWANGTQIWCQHDLVHRERNLPAIIFAEGTRALPLRIQADILQEYWLRGQLHSLLTPANYHNDWSFNGTYYFTS